MKPSWQSRRTAPPWPLCKTVKYASWKEDASVLLSEKEWISPLEANKRWELIKKMANPYEMVFTHEDAAFHPSIASIRPLSRSFFKMIEMLEVLEFSEVIPKQTPKWRTAHIAEGPGGFIQAILLYAERHKKIVQQATAMTLKPISTNIPGWRKAAYFLNQHREVKLHYGEDGTGDACKPENQDSFVEATAPGVHLFTADGGFDFSIDYSKQEENVFQLLMSSFFIGIRSLLIDGCMVVKLFDTFSDSTRILCLFVSRCFKEWMFYKPALSRPCNSERYFIGRGFKGVTRECLDLMVEMQEKCKLGEFAQEFSELCTAEEGEYFRRYHEENVESQKCALERARAFSVCPESWYKTQLPLDFQTSLQWCYKYRIPTHIARPNPIECPSELMKREDSLA